MGGSCGIRLCVQRPKAREDAILGLEFPGRAMRGNHVHLVLLEVVIQAIAVIRPIPNQVLGLGLHVEVET